MGDSVKRTIPSRPIDMGLEKEKRLESKGQK